MTPEELWQATLAQIQLMTSPANFATWFKDTKISFLEKEKVIISVPNSFVKEWLEQKYHKVIFKILKNLEPRVKRIEYKVGKEEEERILKKIDFHKIASPQLGILNLEINEKTNLNPRYTFSNFVVVPLMN